MCLMRYWIHFQQLFFSVVLIQEEAISMQDYVSSGVPGETRVVAHEL